MMNFCTLFDSFYLSRGLVMYESLKKYCKDFHLYIFPFDEKSFQILKAMDLPHTTLVAMAQFENEDLLTVKPTRTKGEYCWTCTSSTILYCLDNFNIDHCTYIDADMDFHSDPIVLFEEMGDRSVLITEHRYTPKYDQSSTSGTYCVQFVTFCKDSRGLTALKWWRDRCIEWCYSRFEDGKFGDQKYLDDWTTRFEGVHVLRHLGGGVAPWNIQQYKLEREGENWYVQERSSGKKEKLVFYHFHYVKLFNDGTVNLSDKYDLGGKNVLSFYKDYLKRLNAVNQRLEKEFNLPTPTVPALPDSPVKKVARKFYRRLKRLKGVYNGLVMKDIVKD